MWRPAAEPFNPDEPVWNEDEVKWSVFSDAECRRHTYIRSRSSQQIWLHGYNYGQMRLHDAYARQPTSNDHDLASIPGAETGSDTTAGQTMPPTALRALADTSVDDGDPVSADTRFFVPAASSFQPFSQPDFWRTGSTPTTFEYGYARSWSKTTPKSEQVSTLQQFPQSPSWVPNASAYAFSPVYGVYGHSWSPPPPVPPYAGTSHFHSLPVRLPADLWSNSNADNTSTVAQTSSAAPLKQAVSNTSPQKLPKKNPTLRLLPVPPPSHEYLKRARAAAVPREHPRPLLVVLDLNGTLLWRKTKSHNFTLRPGLHAFLDYLFSRHRVVVWSSARPETVQAMLNNHLFTEEQKRHIVAVWTRDDLRLTSNHYKQKIQVYKQLQWLWEDSKVQLSAPYKTIGREKWDQTNTVLIDDSAEKAAAQPYNLVQIDEFEALPEQMKSGELVLGQVVQYLEILRGAKDVSAAIHELPYRYAVDSPALQWSTVMEWYDGEKVLGRNWKELWDKDLKMKGKSFWSALEVLTGARRLE